LNWSNIKSIFFWLKNFDNVMAVKSFSKIGCAGLRLGYVIAHPNFINYFSLGQSIFSVPALSQMIGLKILEQIEK